MPVTEERRATILMEETVDRRPSTLDRTDEEREHRRVVRRQVRRLKANGIEVVIPTTPPDLSEPR